MKVKLFSSLLIFLLAFFVKVPGFAQNTSTDPEMIKISKTLLHYFDTIYQRKMLGAMRGPANAFKIEQLTGEYPAMVEEDLTGWHETAWSATYTNRVQEHINNMKEIWNKKKAIPGMCWHWGNPLTGGGTYKASKENLTAEQFNNIVTEGTDEYNTMMEDLRKHADYLQQLADEDIPLIWRPMHEIDGGWFWWTDKNNPENTAKLWKIMYNYLVKERNMHNLIWVYSAGVGNPTKKDLEYRKAFYPGDEYVDMVGIDLYGWDFRNTGIKNYWNATQSYQDAFDILKELAPDKLIILTETDAMPNMEKTFDDNHPNFAKWLWAMPWWAGNDNNPDEWIKKTYTHEKVIMQPDLPDFESLATSSSNYKRNINNQQFSLYPIPGNDIISVKPKGEYHLTVYTLNGKNLISEDSASAITIANLTPGTYLLKILTENATISKIFVKK